MKSILFLTPQLPYPPISGGTIISFKLVELLSKNYNTYLITILKEDDFKYEQVFLTKVNLKFYKSFSINSKRYKRNIKNLLKSYYYNLPFPVYRNFVEEIKKYVNIILNKEKIDIIFVDYFLMFQYIPVFFQGKVICHTHNAEYILWERLSKIENNPLKKALIKLESIRIKNYEKHIYSKADYVLCVSDNDVENIEKLGVVKNKVFKVMSVGDDELLNLPELNFEETEKSILFVGTLSWEPNIDGLKWFIEDCWDILKEYHPDVRFYIVGKNPPEKLIKLSSLKKDIIFIGFVENLEDIYKKARVFISPLRFGSGIKIKNINAMYRGIPLVTTSVGAEGIDGIDGVHFFIAKSKDEIIKKISILLEDKTVWKKLSSESRKLMIEKYTWDKAFRILKELIDNA